MVCLDAGCGGGDVTRELARRVGPRGRAVGVDIDEAKLDIARREAEEAGIRNVEFRALDIPTQDAGCGFDLVYARFLLTHLSNPSSAVAAFYRQLRPGGLVLVEDTDFSGSFTYPESEAFQRYHRLYCAVVEGRGGDPDIGRRLPLLLSHGGFTEVELTVVQPAGTSGEVKLINPLTMENIAEAVLHDGLASREEIDAVVQELYAFAADPRTVAGLPRIVQAWGRR
jgi:SAM-dependent methyltransferase